MKYQYHYFPLEQLFLEHDSPQHLADQIQTFLYFWQRNIDPATFEALEHEYHSLIRLKLALRDTKPVR